MAEFPISGLVSVQFNIVERQNQQNSNDGRGSVFEFGPPYWVADLQYTRISDDQFRTVSAFYKKARGASGDVEIWHPQRQNPLTGGDINPTPSVDVNNGIITVSGGSPSVGDFIGYNAASGTKFLGEITDVDGNDLETVPPPVAFGNTATLVRAMGTFRVQSLQIEEPIGLGAGSITVSLKQVSP